MDTLPYTDLLTNPSGRWFRSSQPVFRSIQARFRSAQAVFRSGAILFRSSAAAYRSGTMVSVFPASFSVNSGSLSVGTGSFSVGSYPFSVGSHPFSVVRGRLSVRTMVSVFCRTEQAHQSAPDNLASNPQSKPAGHYFILFFGTRSNSRKTTIKTTEERISSSGVFVLSGLI